MELIINEKNNNKKRHHRTPSLSVTMSKAACVVFHIFRIETDNLTGLVEFPMHYEQINDFQLFLLIYYYNNNNNNNNNNYYYYYYSINGGFGQALESKN